MAVSQTHVAAIGMADEGGGLFGQPCNVRRDIPSAARMGL